MVHLESATGGFQILVDRIAALESALSASQAREERLLAECAGLDAHIVLLRTALREAPTPDSDLTECWYWYKETRAAALQSQPEGKDT